jgi:hypothetical protein
MLNNNETLTYDMIYKKREPAISYQELNNLLAEHTDRQQLAILRESRVQGMLTVDFVNRGPGPNSIRFAYINASWVHVSGAEISRYEQDPQLQKLFVDMYRETPQQVLDQLAEKLFLFGFCSTDFVIPTQNRVSQFYSSAGRRTGTEQREGGIRERINQAERSRDELRQQVAGRLEGILEIRAQGEGLTAGHLSNFFPPVGESETNRDEEPPNEYLCPITKVIMEDPVVASDGHTYDRASIENWINQCTRYSRPVVSPLTRDPLTDVLTPNHALKRLIEDYKAQLPLMQQRRIAARNRELMFNLREECIQQLMQELIATDSSERPGI